MQTCEFIRTVIDTKSHTKFEFVFGFIVVPRQKIKMSRFANCRTASNRRSLSSQNDVYVSIGLLNRHGRYMYLMFSHLPKDAHTLGAWCKAYKLFLFMIRVF